MTFLVDMCAMVFALPRALLPAIGAVWLGGGEQTAGLLLAAIAAGSFLAALFSGPLGQVRRQGLAVIWSITLWGAAIVALGMVLAAGHRGCWDLALACGCGGGAGRRGGGRLHQLRVPLHHFAVRHPGPPPRTVAGHFVVVVTGGPRLGDAFAGTVGQWRGEGWAAVIGGALCIAAVWGLAAWQRGFVRYDARHPEP